MSTEKTAPKAGSSNIAIDKKLIEEGTRQLTSEIEVLESWLIELEGKDSADSEISATRKSYDDMLRSRKEMLSSLTKQAARQAVSTE